MVRALRTRGHPETRVEAFAGLLGRAERPARSAGAPSALSRRSVAPKVGGGASARRLTLSCAQWLCSRPFAWPMTGCPASFRRRSARRSTAGFREDAEQPLPDGIVQRRGITRATAGTTSVPDNYFELTGIGLRSTDEGPQL